MSLRRGADACLDAADCTVTVTGPRQRRLSALVQSAVVVVSREYRELRLGPQIKRRPVWARLVGWVLRHLPEILLVVLLIRVSQLTAAQIGPLWTNTGTSDHGTSVYFGRCRYCAVPLPAVAIASEDLRGAGPVLEVRGAQR